MLSSVMLTLILPNKFVLFQYFTGKGLGNKEVKKKSEEEKKQKISGYLTNILYCNWQFMCYTEISYD